MITVILQRSVCKPVSPHPQAYNMDSFRQFGNTALAILHSKWVLSKANNRPQQESEAILGCVCMDINFVRGPSNFHVH